MHVIWVQGTHNCELLPMFSGRITSVVLLTFRQTSKCHPLSPTLTLNLCANRKLSSFEFSPWALVQASESALVSIHHYTHLPWWVIIVGTTVILRVSITLPLATHQVKMIAKQELLLPRLKELQEAIRHNVVVKCRRAKLPHTEANRLFQKEAKKAASNLFSKEGCSPYKLYLLPWVQVPLWVSLSFTFRNMTGYFPDCVPHWPESPVTLAQEGTLWFQDLTAVDPYSILPVLVAAFNLTNIELHSMRRKQVTRRMRIITNSFRVLSITGGYISTQIPTAVVLYWVVSSFTALLQNLILMLPKARRCLNVPRVPSEQQKPFRCLMETARLKAKVFLELQRKK